jgi:hypothetical protein
MDTTAVRPASLEPDVNVHIGTQTISAGTSDCSGWCGTNGWPYINGAEDQVMYTLNGFNLRSLTGRFESRLSVESVQSAEIPNLAAESAGSAGTLAVQTRRVTTSCVTGHQFVPGFENRKGLYIGG